jgi:hypothetical protein
MEEWKDVVGYEGLYQVSNLGRIKSLPRISKTTRGAKEFKYLVKGQILTPQKRRHGYLSVFLYGKSQEKGSFEQKSVHRLVAEAFIPNPNGFAEVNHIDEDKQNNKAENLEWITHADNTNYGNAQKKRIAKLINGPKAKAVSQFDLDGRFIRTFPSMAEVKRQLGYDQSNIHRAANGKYFQAYGYLWRYAN